ncbi:MAG: RNA methyltransferase [Bacteroidales bacterium]
MTKKLSMEELGRVSPEEYKEQAKIPLIVILDSIRSMNNVGSIFRTSDAFAIEKIYLCGITACPPHKEITKTALGATETVKWEYVEDVVTLSKQLQLEGYSVYMIEQTDHAVMLEQFQLPDAKKTAIVLGNEVFGVDDRLLDICDGAIEIPQYGVKHSLNVSIAGGIVIWEIFRKMTT